MKKLKIFFEKNSMNIVHVLAGIPLFLFVIFMIYSFFSKGLSEDLKNIINSIDVFSLFVGVIITLIIQGIIETRKENKRNKKKDII